MFVKEFEVGDLVWAKMRNFPPWPGQIVDPPANAKPRKGSHYVFFFGSKNYAWMKDETINHHAEHLIPSPSKKKTTGLQSAIEEIVELSKDRPIKVDRIVDSDDSSLLEDFQSTKPSKGHKSVNGKRSKVSGKRRLSSSKMGIKSRKMESLDGGNCSKEIDTDYQQLPFECDSSESEEDDDDDDSVISQDNYRGFHSTILMESLNHYSPTSRKIGFLGLGKMGKCIATNLLDSGHKVIVWNRTPGKFLDLMKAGADPIETPAEVVKAADIIFCCVSDSYAVRSILFGHNGVLKGLEESVQAAGGGRIYKGYVEMSSIDYETSKEISEAISIKGGKYLEASIVGSKALAEEGNILILASGNRALFDDCLTCFYAMSKLSCFLSCDVGASLKYSVIISGLMGTTFAAMAEAMALAERESISRPDFFALLQMKGFTCPEVLNRAKSIVKNNVGVLDTPLKHQQKDIALTLAMANQFSQPMPVTTAANELYKHAKLLGYADHDMTAVFYGSKF